MSRPADLTETRSSSEALEMSRLRLPADYAKDTAARYPDALAIECDGEKWTYAELDRAADGVVSVLRSENMRSGDRVAYLGRNSIFFFGVLFGAMRCGVVLVPINWRNVAAETRFVLNDSGAKLAFIDEAFESIFREASPNGLPFIVVDGETDQGLRARLEDTGPAPSVASDPYAPALLIYTSGTTGTPKGVLVTQHGLAAQRAAENASRHFDDWREDEIIFSPLPVFHIGGISWALCGFARGIPVIITADASPSAIVRAIVSFSVTRAFLVPTLIRSFIEEIRSRGLESSSLRGVHYGAAAMDPRLLDLAIATLGCAFLQYYGMTEATGTVSILGPREHDSARPDLLRSVGRPLPGFSIEIRNEARRPLPVDAPGEIWVQGPSLTTGYWKQTGSTAEAFVDGWYRTGDGGRIDEAGFLFLTDRIKDMIISGGENVYPVEVEAALRDHPAVADCAVFARAHPKWGEMVAAAIELRSGHTADSEELIAFARTRLAAFKIPRSILFNVPLPRTPSGKIQRAALRAALLDQD